MLKQHLARADIDKIFSKLEGTHKAVCYRRGLNCAAISSNFEYERHPEISAMDEFIKLNNLPKATELRWVRADIYTNRYPCKQCQAYAIDNGYVKFNIFVVEEEK